MADATITEQQSCDGGQMSHGDNSDNSSNSNDDTHHAPVADVAAHMTDDSTPSASSSPAPSSLSASASASASAPPSAAHTLPTTRLPHFPVRFATIESSTSSSPSSSSHHVAAASFSPHSAASSTSASRHDSESSSSIDARIVDDENDPAHAVIQPSSSVSDITVISDESSVLRDPLFDTLVQRQLVRDMQDQRLRMKRMAGEHDEMDHDAPTSASASRSDPLVRTLEWLAVNACAELSAVRREKKVADEEAEALRVQTAVLRAEIAALRGESQLRSQSVSAPHCQPAVTHGNARKRGNIVSIDGDFIDRNVDENELVSELVTRSYKRVCTDHTSLSINHQAGEGHGHDHLRHVVSSTTTTNDQHQHLPQQHLGQAERCDTAAAASMPENHRDDGHHGQQLQDDVSMDEMDSRMGRGEKPESGSAAAPAMRTVPAASRENRSNASVTAAHTKGIQRKTEPTGEAAEADATTTDVRWNDLDFNIFALIMQFLPFDDVIAASRTCWEWTEACNNPLIWQTAESARPVLVAALSSDLDEVRYSYTYSPLSWDRQPNRTTAICQTGTLPQPLLEKGIHRNVTHCRIIWAIRATQKDDSNAKGGAASRETGLRELLRNLCDTLLTLPNLSHLTIDPLHLCAPIASHPLAKRVRPLTLHLPSAWPGRCPAPLMMLHPYSKLRSFVIRCTENRSDYGNVSSALAILSKILPASSLIATDEMGNTIEKKTIHGLPPSLRSLHAGSIDELFGFARNPWIDVPRLHPSSDVLARIDLSNLRSLTLNRITCSNLVAICQHGNMAKLRTLSSDLRLDSDCDNPDYDNPNNPNNIESNVTDAIASLPQLQEVCIRLSVGGTCYTIRPLLKAREDPMALLHLRKAVIQLPIPRDSATGSKDNGASSSDSSAMKLSNVVLPSLQDVIVPLFDPSTPSAADLCRWAPNLTTMHDRSSVNRCR